MGGNVEPPDGRWGCSWADTANRRGPTHPPSFGPRMTRVKKTVRSREPGRRIRRGVAVFGALLAILAGCASGPTTTESASTTSVGAASVGATSIGATSVGATAGGATSAPSGPAAQVSPSASTSTAADPSPPAPSTAEPGRPEEPESDPAIRSSAPPSITDAIKPAAGSMLLPPSQPVSLSAPAIGITSSLIDLGRNADGTIEVPSLEDPKSEPGWYTNSPSPGTLGPAIILGHVDSRQYGPGVFYSLSDLQPGDDVDVARADGTVALFVVDAVRTVSKSDFPTRQVYGNLDHAGLRLITCGGEFDPDARSYESNVIVFASLIGSRAA